MKQLRVLGIVCIYAIGIVSGAFAEDPRSGDGPSEPDQPDIILPTEVFELEAFNVEAVSAPLPQTSEIRIPALPVPLPDSGEIEVTDAALALQPLSPADQQSTMPLRGVSSVFSTARLGFGTRNWLFGDLSVFALGTEPRFSFEFRHESLDGFGTRQAGTGYFSGVDSITGDIDYSSENTELETSLSFDSRRDGFQGQGPYLSLDQRFSRLGIEASHRTTNTVSFSGGAHIDLADRVFTDPESPDSEQALDASVEGRVAIGSDRFEVSMNSQYLQSWIDRDSDGLILNGQTVSGGLSLDLSFDNGLLVDSSAGVAWRPGERLVVPFSLGVSGSVSDRLSLELRTGQNPAHVSYVDLWDSVQAIETPQTSVWGNEWYGRMAATWFVRRDTTISGEGRFRYWSDTYDVGPFAGGVHSFISVPERTSVQSSIQAAYTPRPEFRGAVDLDVNLISARTIDPSFSIGLETELLTPDGLSGMLVRMDTAFFLEETRDVTPVMPELDISGFYSLTDIVQVSLGIRDVLDLVDRDTPRFLYRSADPGFPLIEPGFRATLSAQLSL